MARRGAAVGFIAMAFGLVLGWRALEAVRVQAADPAPPSQVPVTTAVAQVQDVPVFLTGLGTVQAFNSVEIRAQVNGTLIALPAREGQEVQPGDVVAQIDPRPYQAALASASHDRRYPL